MDNIIENLNFGAGTSEYEIKNGKFSPNYITLEDQCTLISCDKVIIWGERGSGKTALKYNMIKNNKKTISAHIDFRDNQDWVYSAIYSLNLMNENFKGFSKYKWVQNSWDKAIFSKLMYEYSKQHKNTPDVIIRYLRTTESFKNRNVGHIFLTIVQTLMPFIDKLFLNSTNRFIQNGIVTVEALEKVNEEVISNSTYTSAKEAFIKTLKTKDIKIFISADSVDQWLDNPKYLNMTIILILKAF